MSRDGALTDEVALIAAAAGVELLTHRDATELPGAGDRGLVMVAADALSALERIKGSGRGHDGAGLVLVGALGEQQGLWEAAAVHPGARVAVLPEAAAWLGEYLGALSDSGGDGQVTSVTGACGGAGTTTVAALIACAATRVSRSVVLIDADPHSAGLWPLLGMPPAVGLSWEDTEGSHGRIPPQQLMQMLPQLEGLHVMTWRGQVESGADGGRRWSTPRDRDHVLRELVQAARQAFDVVVIDAGRRANASVLTLVDTQLVVVAAARAAHLGASAAAEPGGAAPTRAVVTGSLPTGVDVPAVTRHLGVEPAAHLPRLRSIRLAAADGQLMRAAGRRDVARFMRPLVALAAPAGAAPKSVAA